MHEKLRQIVPRLNTDYEPFGKAEREGPDCSGGCRHFIKLVVLPTGDGFAYVCTVEGGTEMQSWTPAPNK